MAPKFYTVEEVAELTQMSPKWLWRQCREERIPHHRFGTGQRCATASARKTSAASRQKRAR